MHLSQTLWFAEIPEREWEENRAAGHLYHILGKGRVCRKQVRHQGRKYHPSNSNPWSHLTLHNVIVPAVGKLSILPTYVQATEVNFIWLTVFELNELPQPGQELRVAIGSMFV